MIPTQDKKSAWEQVVNFEQGAQLQEIMKPIICSFMMQDKQKGVKNDEARSKAYAALLAEASEAITNIHGSEENVLEQRRAANNNIIAMLSNCKKLRAREMPEPLSDNEYDALMHQYAKLNGADASSLEQEIADFTKKVLMVRANAKLSKLSDSGFASQLNLLTDGDYDVLKRETREAGEDLIRKLGRMHGDPLLKSRVSDDVYNRLQKSKDSLDAVFEDEALSSDPVFNSLLEIEAIGHAYHSGQKDVIDDKEYDLKKDNAMEMAHAVLNDPSTPSHVRAKIGEKLRDIGQINQSSPSEGIPLMMHLLKSSRVSKLKEVKKKAPAIPRAFESSDEVFGILPGSVGT